MGLFDFFKKKSKEKDNDPQDSQKPVDKSDWTGEDFEFLITGDIEISTNDFDEIMTPNSIAWTKSTKENVAFYQVSQDEFSYSWEIPGVQMTFNKEISYDKARRIVEEVIDNIKRAGQDPELVELNNKKVHRF